MFRRRSMWLRCDTRISRRCVRAICSWLHCRCCYLRCGCCCLRWRGRLTRRSTRLHTARRCDARWAVSRRRMWLRCWSNDYRVSRCCVCAICSGFRCRRCCICWRDRLTSRFTRIHTARRRDSRWAVGQRCRMWLRGTRSCNSAICSGQPLRGHSLRWRGRLMRRSTRLHTARRRDARCAVGRRRLRCSTQVSRRSLCAVLRCRRHRCLRLRGRITRRSSRLHTACRCDARRAMR